MQWLDEAGVQQSGGPEPWLDMPDGRDAQPKKSLGAAASSQVLINSPASHPAEKCLPSAWLPLQDSWIAESVPFRAAKRPNPARKNFDEVSPDLPLEERAQRPSRLGLPISCAVFGPIRSHGAQRLVLTMCTQALGAVVATG